MTCCDSSPIVALVTSEPYTDRVREWFLSPSDAPCASGWVDAEVAAALAQKVRLGAIDRATAAARGADWRRLARDNFHHIALVERHVALAAMLVEVEGVSRRAGGALHLAVARD